MRAAHRDGAAGDPRAILCRADEVNYLSGPGKGVILIKLSDKDRVSGFSRTVYLPVNVACPLKTDSIAAAAHFSPSPLDTPIAPMT